MQKDSLNVPFGEAGGGSYRILNAQRVGKTPLLLICDHASNLLPQNFDHLGLHPKDLERHIAYDLGAEPLTRVLSQLLDVPAILTNYSRLLIDCNRGRDDPTLIMSVSDSTIIPGNRMLSNEMYSDRISRFYDPYHEAIDAMIDQILSNNIVPILLSIHTFTPLWKGFQRPWHVGVLWDNDPRLSVPLLRKLAGIPNLFVGDNEPYRGWLRGDCLWKHGTLRGLPHALIEIRQDELKDENFILKWGEYLSKILTSIWNEKNLRTILQTIKHYGSKTDIRYELNL